MPGARADQFAGPDRRMSFVQDRGTWHDFSQGPFQQTGGPLDVAIDGDGFFVVQTPARRTLHPQRRVSDQQRRRARDQRRRPVLGDGGPIILQPTDRDIVVTSDGTIKVREGLSLTSDSTRGKLRLVTFANPQSLQKDGTSMFAAPAGVQAQPAQKDQRRAGRDRKIQRALRRSR